MLGLIISLIVVGLIAGALARLIVPGKQSISIGMTIVLGIVGSFVGGFLGFLIFQHDPMDGFLQPAGIIGSIIGAIIVLLVYTRFAGRSAARLIPVRDPAGRHHRITGRRPYRHDSIHEVPTLSKASRVPPASSLSLWSRRRCGCPASACSGLRGPTAPVEPRESGVDRLAEVGVLAGGPLLPGDVDRGEARRGEHSGGQWLRAPGDEGRRQ